MLSLRKVVLKLFMVFMAVSCVAINSHIVLAVPIDNKFDGTAVNKIVNYRNIHSTLGGNEEEVYLSELIVRHLHNPKELKSNVIDKKFDKWILHTPFGDVDVFLESNDIKVKNKDLGYTYRYLAKYVDTKYKNNKDILQTIYDYLSIRGKDLKSIEKIKIKRRDPILASLCGILMVAEPYRFEDGGKLSRASLRMIYVLMQKNIEDPYSQMFVSAKFEKVKVLLEISDNAEFKFDEKNFKEGVSVFSHGLNSIRKHKNAKNSPRGKQQQLNQFVNREWHSFETKESFEDNTKRMNCFNGYVSDTDLVKVKPKTSTNASTKKISKRANQTATSANLSNTSLISQPEGETDEKPKKQHKRVPVKRKLNHKSKNDEVDYDSDEEG